jgi:hypothetical protein
MPTRLFALVVLRSAIDRAGGQQIDIDAAIRKAEGIE